MTELFNLPEETPPWQEIASRHGITTKTWSEMGISISQASIEMFGRIEYETGETAQEAVTALAYRLKLGK
jgi:hypothetical protein